MEFPAVSHLRINLESDVYSIAQSIMFLARYYLQVTCFSQNFEDVIEANITHHLFCPAQILVYSCNYLYCIIRFFNCLNKLRIYLNS